MHKAPVTQTGHSSSVRHAVTLAELARTARLLTASHPGNPWRHRGRLTATVQTAAATGQQQRPATAHNARTIRANLGYARPEKQTVGDQRRGCECSKTVAKLLNSTRHTRTTLEYLPSPQTRNGRSWTACPLLRSRCSGPRWSGEHRGPVIAHEQGRPPLTRQRFPEQTQGDKGDYMPCLVRWCRHPINSARYHHFIVVGRSVLVTASCRGN